MEPKLTKPLPEPAILTDDVTNAEPGVVSAIREANQQRVLRAVGDYFASLGLAVLQTENSMTGQNSGTDGRPATLHASFTYLETYQAVSKCFEVKRRVSGRWRRASISHLRAHAAKADALYLKSINETEETL